MEDTSLIQRGDKACLKKFFLYFLVSVCLILHALPGSAQDFTNISADHLEYLSEESIYRAKGAVSITYEDSTLTADEMEINSSTYDAVAVGNVIYSDSEAIIHAHKIELNLKTKLGTIYDTYSFYKKNNFHLQSGKITKTGDKSFTLDKATVTTCDADPPEWSISAQDIAITQHEHIKGWHSTLNIKNTPVLYAPYFWASLNKERQTGLLFPSFGYSSKRGYFYKQGFFWAIKENHDATFYLDYYDNLEFAEGLDYRYIVNPETYGEIWMYNVRDKDRSRNLFEMKSYHNVALPYDIDGKLKIDAVSHSDYYDIMGSTSKDRFGLSTWDPMTFGFASDEVYQKYLESNLEVSKNFFAGRTYLLAEGRQSLEGSSEEVPQTLPEIALILNTRSKEFFSYNLSMKGINFWREKGQEGIRLDFNPDLFFSYGRLFNITQKVGLRETVYFLNEPEEFDNRFIYELGTTLSTALFKRYSTFIHLIEPVLNYTYIPDVDQDEVPIFDATDRIPETNNVTYALTNRFSGLGSNYLEAWLRVSQSYSLLRGSNPFSPVLTEATVASTNLDLNVNMSYDVNENHTTEVISSAVVKGSRGYIGVGKDYRRATKLDQYTFMAGMNGPLIIFNRSYPIDFQGKLWYDAENNRVQELDVTYRYTKQCWGYSVTYKKRPDDYEVSFAIELSGLGSFSLDSF